MVSQSPWNERRIAGILLILGWLLFWIAAFMPLVNKDGNSIYLLPLKEQLSIIASNAVLWHWANALFIAGAIVSVFGMVMLTAVLQDAGEGMLSRLGLVAGLIGAIMWSIVIAFRSGVGTWVARETMKTGTMPSFYEGISEGMQLLFLMYTVLTALAIVAYGGALLRTRLLPVWVGIVVIVYGALELVVLLLIGDLPPFVQYVIFLLFGVFFMLPKYRVSPRISNVPVTQLEG